jgi:hypothetical protein
MRQACTETRCLSHLQPQLACVMLKKSVRTAKKTQHLTITKFNRLTLFKEIIAVYSENHTEHVKAPWAECRIDCYISWYVQLPLGFRGLSLRNKTPVSVTKFSVRNSQRQEALLCCLPHGSPLLKYRGIVPCP